MEAMAPDEMDQDHRQKRGREELERTAHSHIRAEEQGIKELREEIGELREEISAKEQKISAKEQEISAKEQKISAKEQEISAKEQELSRVEMELASASGTEVRSALEAKVQSLRRQIERDDQQIISLREEQKSLRKEIKSLRKEIKSLRKEIKSLRKEIKSLREEIKSRDQQTISLRKETKSLQSVQADGDRSVAWMRHMLLPQVPELPSNWADLSNVLFPREQHQKLPVTKEFYGHMMCGLSSLAAEVLIEADGSRLPSAVATFLQFHPGHITTEMQTTILVGGSLNLFFDIFKKYSKDTFGLTLTFNSTEKRGRSHSQSTERRSRPDTIAVASGCAFLVGEDKVVNLHAAEEDLRSKIKPLNPTYYGNLKFILGYIAAGTKFQWIYIGKNGSKDLHPIGPCLDLSEILDRCKFLLSIGYAFQLLKKMADSVPNVPGRRAMFSVEASSDGKREVSFFADKVAKRIKDFGRYCANQRTSLHEIKRAYQVAEGCPFLLQAVKWPTVSRGTYKVECIPLGYSCLLNSEQDCRWMARCVCQALRTFHNAGLVHRDVRLPNVVRLSETGFMLIDFESVANSPFELHEGFRHFVGWKPKMFEGNKYTAFSDMYSLGKLLDDSLSVERTSLAGDFVRKVTNKQLNASDALQHPWLSELTL